MRYDAIIFITRKNYVLSSTLLCYAMVKTSLITMSNTFVFRIVKLT